MPATIECARRVSPGRAKYASHVSIRPEARSCFTPVACMSPRSEATALAMAYRLALAADSSLGAARASPHGHHALATTAPTRRYAGRPLGHRCACVRDRGGRDVPGAHGEASGTGMPNSAYELLMRSFVARGLSAASMASTSRGRVCVPWSVGDRCALPRLVSCVGGSAHTRARCSRLIRGTRAGGRHCRAPPCGAACCARSATRTMRPAARTWRERSTNRPSGAMAPHAARIHGHRVDRAAREHLRAASGFHRPHRRAH